MEAGTDPDILKFRISSLKYFEVRGTFYWMNHVRYPFGYFTLSQILPLYYSIYFYLSGCISTNMSLSFCTHTMSQYPSPVKNVVPSVLCMICKLALLFYLPTYIRTYLTVCLSMALQPFVGTWTFFQFLKIFTQLVRLLGGGISPSQRRYLTQNSTSTE
jgi:hypothetical protein